jgi:uncharacterized protein YhfF
LAVDNFWQEFLVFVNLPSDKIYYDSFYFGHTEELAESLLELVLTGKKKATATSLLALELENERVPQAGDFSIVTDFKGNPQCVIKTTNVAIMPFNELTYDIVKREGEDDTLESWQEGHRRFYEADGKEVGYKFTETMPVVFEDFEVVFTK